MLPSPPRISSQEDLPLQEDLLSQEDAIAADPLRLQALFGGVGHRGLRGVQVSVQDDRVVLSGTVSSYYLKQMAQERIRQACPKVKLSNVVVVQPPA